MLIRIVRMTFHPEALPTFEALFAQYQAAIRAFPGCQHLELHTDPGDPRVRYTLSHWESADALNAYRDSAVFGTVWPQTKVLFAAAPQAFSLQHQLTVPGPARQD